MPAIDITDEVKQNEIKTVLSRGVTSCVATSHPLHFLNQIITMRGRSQWPRGLRRRPAVVCLLGLWVRIPPEAWMFVSCECCVLSDRGLCDELITRQEESYRRWCAIVCDLETSGIRKPWPTGGCREKKKIKDSDCNVMFLSTM